MVSLLLCYSLLLASGSIHAGCQCVHAKENYCVCVCVRVDAGTSSHIWRDLQVDVNWRRRSNSISWLATHHTGELALTTEEKEKNKKYVDFGFSLSSLNHTTDIWLELLFSCE